MPDYTPHALDHFVSPRNAGALEKADRVGTAGTPGQGPHVQMFVKLASTGTADAHAPVIADIRFKTWGCPAATTEGPPPPFSRTLSDATGLDSANSCTKCNSPDTRFRRRRIGIIARPKEKLRAS